MAIEAVFGYKDKLIEIHYLPHEDLYIWEAFQGTEKTHKSHSGFSTVDSAKSHALGEMEFSYEVQDFEAGEEI